MGSASHKSCAASAHATTLKILRRKRFRKPQKIIVLQAQPLARDVLKRIILIDLLLKPHWVTVRKPIFKTNYARYQISN